MLQAILLTLPARDCRDLIKHRSAVLTVNTVPMRRTPFRVYIFCSYPDEFHNSTLVKHCDNTVDCMESDEVISTDILLNGKILGEFVCVVSTSGVFLDYRLYIRDLKIYDEPKTLIEFNRHCPDNPMTAKGLYCNDSECEKVKEYSKDFCSIECPYAQKWCFVDELFVREKEKICEKCGDDKRLLYEYDAEVLCSKCMQQKLHIQEKYIYFCENSNSTYGNLSEALEREGAVKLK